MRKYVKEVLEGTIIDVGLFNNGHFERSAKPGHEPEMLFYIETETEWLQIRMNMTSAAKLGLFFDGDSIGMPTCRVQ